MIVNKWCLWILSSYILETTLLTSVLVFKMLIKAKEVTKFSGKHITPQDIYYNKVQSVNINKISFFQFLDSILDEFLITVLGYLH